MFLHSDHVHGQRAVHAVNTSLIARVDQLQDRNARLTTDQGASQATRRLAASGQAPDGEDVDYRCDELPAAVLVRRLTEYVWGRPSLTSRLALSLDILTKLYAVATNSPHSPVRSSPT